MYYGYADIEQIQQEKLQGRLSRKELARRKPISFKAGSLLFRLTNCFAPGNILEIGTAWGVSTLYLHFGCKSARLACIEPDSAVAAMAATVIPYDERVSIHTGVPLSDALARYLSEETNLDFICIHPLQNPEDYTWLLPRLIEHSGDRTVWFIQGIRSHRQIADAWKSLVENETVRVTMDLYDIGLAFNNPKLNKQDYLVAF